MYLGLHLDLTFSLSDFSIRSEIIQVKIQMYDMKKQ